jgi:histone-lysine N-methyltransferase SETD7
MVGGGYITGVLDDNGRITGDDIAYIYPDGRTALVGQFDDGYMVEAREAVVGGRLTCDIEWNVPRADFSETERKVSSHTFLYDPSTNESFGSTPHLKDPLDAGNVQVKLSNIAGGGEGAFALKDFTAGQVVALYNGLRYTPEQRQTHQAMCHNNVSLKAEERRACTKYQIELDSLPGHYIDLPPWLDGDQHYSATSGHKVNCAFGERANAAFYELEHPRFGLILSIMTTKPVAKGQEFFIDYGYKKGEFPSDHPWYHEAKRKWLDQATSSESP